MDEQTRILKLLERRKITAEEAARLLDVLGPGPARPGSGQARLLKVRVLDRDTGRTKVNVVLPISLVRWGLQFVPQSARMELNQRQIDFSELADALNAGHTGRLLELEDAKDNERVEIYVE